MFKIGLCVNSILAIAIKSLKNKQTSMRKIYNSLRSLSIVIVIYWWRKNLSEKTKHISISMCFSLTSDNPKIRKIRTTEIIIIKSPKYSK